MTEGRVMVNGGAEKWWWRKGLEKHKGCGEWWGITRLRKGHDPGPSTPEHLEGEMQTVQDAGMGEEP